MRTKELFEFHQEVIDEKTHQRDKLRAESEVQYVESDRVNFVSIDKIHKQNKQS